MNKRLSLIYALCFLSILPLTYAIGFITAQTWADIILVISLLCGAYVLSYIIFLRKKDGVSFGRAVARFFLYLFTVTIVRVLMYYIKIFFAGYIPCDMLGNPIGERIWGLRAIMADSWENLVYVPLLCISALYVIIYLTVSKRLKKNS